jgi:uncharacterized protein YodC (DUF2158 family)
MKTLAALVLMGLVATGCEGADQGPEETVTERSALCVDNLSGTYNIHWYDGARPDVWEPNGIRLSTYIRTCSYVVPQGPVVGGMSFFNPNGPYDTVVGAHGSDIAWWNGSRTVFYMRDPNSPRWYRNTCTSGGTHKWNCYFDGLSEFDGTWGRDGFMVLY